MPRSAGTRSGLHQSRNQRRLLEAKYGPLICDHYEIGRAIGEGTFGKVRLGVHKLSGVQVAIKILIKKKITDLADIERVSREISILKRIRHINIIRLYEVIDTSKYIFLIMEYANNGEVFDYIVSKTRLSESEGCKFLHMIVNGIDYCHHHGIIHRDLKPENLLLNKFNEIKIVDFGLGQIIDQKDKFLKTACGSPCYAAPEMIAGKPYKGQSADIWSIGVILYALLCGYLPFEHANTNVLYKKIIRGHFESPSWISNAAKSLLHKMLNTDPATRYTIHDIRRHPWYRQQSVLSDPLPGVTTKSGNGNGKESGNLFEVDTVDTDKLNDTVLKQMEMIGYDMEKSLRSVRERKHDHFYATYHLLKVRENSHSAQSINHQQTKGVAMIDKIIMKINQKKAKIGSHTASNDEDSDRIRVPQNSSNEENDPITANGNDQAGHHDSITSSTPSKSTSATTTSRQSGHAGSSSSANQHQDVTSTSNSMQTTAAILQQYNFQSITNQTRIPKTPPQIQHHSHHSGGTKQWHHGRHRKTTKTSSTSRGGTNGTTSSRPSSAHHSKTNKKYYYVPLTAKSPVTTPNTNVVRAQILSPKTYNLLHLPQSNKDHHTPQKLLHHHLAEQTANAIANATTDTTSSVGGKVPLHGFEHNTFSQKPNIPKLNLSIVHNQNTLEQGDVDLDITRRRGKVYGTHKNKKATYSLTAREAMRQVRRSYLDDLRKQVLTPTFHPPPKARKSHISASKRNALHSAKRKKARPKRKSCGSGSRPNSKSRNTTRNNNSYQIGVAQTYRPISGSSQSSNQKKRRNRGRKQGGNANLDRLYPKTSRYAARPPPRRASAHSQARQYNQNRNKYRPPSKDKKYAPHSAHSRTGRGRSRGSSGSRNSNHSIHSDYKWTRKVAATRNNVAGHHHEMEEKRERRSVRSQQRATNPTNSIIHPPHLNISRKVKKVVKSSRNARNSKPKNYTTTSRRSSLSSTTSRSGSYDRRNQNHPRPPSATTTPPHPNPPMNGQRVIGGDRKQRQNGRQQFKRASGVKIKQSTKREFDTKKQPVPPSKMRPKPPSAPKYHGRKKYNSRVMMAGRRA